MLTRLNSGHGNNLTSVIVARDNESGTAVLKNHLAIKISRLAAAGALLLCFVDFAGAQTENFAPPDLVQGSLAEVRDKRRVLLHVSRTPIIDSRDFGRAIINEAYRSNRPRNRGYAYARGTVAKKLNDYVRKYKSMGAVENVEDADFIIFFNVLEFRRSLGTFYPYGELFVILNQPPTSTVPPRIIWKTDRVLWAEDAAKKLIKELKLVRGER